MRTANPLRRTVTALQHAGGGHARARALSGLRLRAHLCLALLCCAGLVLGSLGPAAASANNQTVSERLHALARSIAEMNVDRQRAVIHPSPLYRDGMWLRDAFYITAALNDPALSQRVFETFASLQRDDGNIPNSYYFGERDPDYRVDDSALFFLIWAYRDALVHRIEYDRALLDRTLQFVKANLYEGRYVTPAGVSMSWLDTLRYREPDVLAHNQGLLAVALRGARALGLKVSDAEIAGAEAGYRSLYRADLGYMPHSLRLAHRDSSALVGEFFSQWLFGQPLLSDAIVSGTLTSLKATPAGFKNIADRRGEYLPGTDFDPPTYAGDYQNGGSWFLYDYISLSVGLLHGVPGSRDLLRWRLEVEWRPGDDLREYLQTNWELPYYLSSPPHRSRYGWNAFAIVVDSVVARRDPQLALRSLDSPQQAANDDLPFAGAYVRLGGKETLGEALTGRFVWEGAIVQVFERGVLFARPGSNRVFLLDVMDELSRAGLDDKLHQDLSTPRRLPDSYFTGTPEEQREQRLKLLEANEALRQLYYAVQPERDPEVLYGLPTSEVEDRGDLNVIRLQRAVLQEWKVDTPFAKAGTTAVANAGELAMLAGLFRDWRGPIRR